MFDIFVLYFRNIVMYKPALGSMRKGYNRPKSMNR